MTLKEQKHLLHVFATFGAGGPQVQFCQIANHFGDRYRHTIIAMDHNYGAKERLRSDLSFGCVSLMYDKKQSIRNFILFRKKLSELKPDLLVTYNWGAIEWAMVNFFFPVCPHIHCEHGFRPDEIGGQFLRRVLFRRIFLKRSLKVVVPSKTMQEIAIDTWKINQEKVLYIPNGIDVKKFQWIDRGYVPNNSESLTIGTVAHLRKEKNIHRMIRVFRSLKANITGHVELHIIGNGSEYESLSEYTRELDLTGVVRFLGSMDNPLPEMRKFDIFIISSDTEQMPYSVLEAMASSLPVVGTDVGDVKQMVSDGNKAYIVQKDNEWVFTNKLLELVVNENLRVSLGRENYNKCVQRYSTEVMFSSFGKILG